MLLETTVTTIALQMDRLDKEEENLVDVTENPDTDFLPDR